MNTTNITVEELKSLLEDIKAELDEVQRKMSVLAQRRSELTEEANTVSGALYSYQKRHSLVTESTPEVDISIIEGARTQEEALIRLAKSKPGKQTKAGDSWPYLIASGLMKPLPRDRAYVNTYSVLNRSEHFEAVAPGEFRLIDDKAKEPNISRQPEQIELDIGNSTLTQARIKAIGVEASKHDNHIRHQEAVAALESAGFTKSARLHAINALTKSGYFEKVDDGRYRWLGSKREASVPQPPQSINQ